MRLQIIPPVVLLSALLAGCAGPALSPEEQAALTAPARALEARGQWREAALAWRNLAETSAGDEGLAFRLNAADALLQAGDGLGAAALARTLPERLPGELNLRRALVLADASLLTGDPTDALARVGPGVSSEDRSLLARYRRVRSDALEASGDLLGAARERALRDPLLTSPPETYRNRQEIWALLVQVPAPELDAQPLSPPRAESGWIELASIARRNQLDPGALDRAVAAWSQRYPGHPAGEQLVPELLERARVESQPPTKIALLLPQSGPFADAAVAVRDGFLAAWFADAPNPNRPEIIVRDSAAGNVALTYGSAVAQGVQFVVGPLAKEAVNSLLLEADLSVVTLMLNYPSVDVPVQPAGGAGAAGGPPAAPAAATPSIDAGAAPVPPAGANAVAPASAPEAAGPVRDLQRVYHFALAPEHEARRAAEYAYSRGARQAAVLAPQGTWGERVGDAFAARWRELGGILADSVAFPEEATGLSTAIEHLLNIDDSEQRARALRALLVRDIKHEPEPRSDLDVIFLASFPQSARQLRPLLLFHRAGDVPVVATSHVYSGTPDAAADQDIDGITFGDMPWVLHPDTFSLPSSVRAAWPAAAGALGRLYAFGADAYALVSKLRDLRASPTTSFAGLTGRLSLGPDRRLRRDLDWAQVRAGVPVLVESTSAAGSAPASWGTASRR